MFKSQTRYLLRIEVNQDDREKIARKSNRFAAENVKTFELTSSNSTNPGKVNVSFSKIMLPSSGLPRRMYLLEKEIKNKKVKVHYFIATNEYGMERHRNLE